MMIQPEALTNQEFFNQVWTKDFNQKIVENENLDIPSEVLSQIKDPDDVSLYTLQVNQHQKGILSLLISIGAQLKESEQEAFYKLAQKELKSHRQQFIHSLVIQCQDAFLNYLQMKYGKTEEVINDKAAKITTENIKKFLQENSIVVLDFWAPWCAPCISIAPVINQLAEQYEGRVGIGKVNIDENESLVKEYKIASIPTLVFIKEGKVETQIVGLHSLEVLQNNVDRLLDQK